MKIFVSLSKDDQDSVRYLCIENCISIGEILSPEERETHLLPIILACASDPAWRIRYAVAKFFQSLVNILGDDSTKELLNPFVNLLSDTEPEVRCIAAGSITSFCSKLEVETIISDIIPCIEKLVSDDSDFVRASVALNIGGLYSLLGQENTTKHLNDSIITILRDDSSEVILNLLSHLSNLTDIMQSNKVTKTILSALETLVTDQNWRIRLTVIEHLPLIAREMDLELFTDTKIGDICFRLLDDNVVAIRTAVIDNLIKLTDIYGKEWAKEYILPKLEHFAKNSNYICRLTTLKSIIKLHHLFEEEDVSSILLPIVNELSNDKVPNIKFNVCSTLEIISVVLSKSAIKKKSFTNPRGDEK